MKITASLAAIAASMTIVAGAQAQSQYVRGSAGFAMLEDSDNSGAFTQDFALGVIDATVPSGTGLGWTTEFDNGLFLSGAYGVALENGLRFEGEVSFSNNDVDTHSGVTVALDGFGNIDGVDAGVLLGATQTEPLGVTVGDLVADGQGSVETLSIAANAYYDIAFEDTPFSVYIGGGLGFAQVDVDYSPSGVGIIDDDDTVFLYQIMLGGEYMVSEGVSLYTGYRFRATEDVETEVALFPAALEIENTANIIEAGVRFTF